MLHVKGSAEASFYSANDNAAVMSGMAATTETLSNEDAIKNDC
jgi:hypothetical protein